MAVQVFRDKGKAKIDAYDKVQHIRIENNHLVVTGSALTDAHDVIAIYAPRTRDHADAGR